MEYSILTCVSFQYCKIAPSGCFQEGSMICMNINTHLHIYHFSSSHPKILISTLFTNRPVHIIIDTLPIVYRFECVLLLSNSNGFFMKCLCYNRIYRFFLQTILITYFQFIQLSVLGLVAEDICII